MPRLLSSALTREIHQVESTHVFTMLFQLDIAGAPGVFRLAAYDQDITFHGLVYTRMPLDVDALEDASAQALVSLRVTVNNVDQQIQSLLENYWANTADPRWQVTIWQIDATQPDETPYESGEVFTVTQVTTDLLSAVFELAAEGLTLTTTLPKRRYTVSNGFVRVPRR